MLHTLLECSRFTRMSLRLILDERLHCCVDLVEERVHVSCRGLQSLSCYILLIGPHIGCQSLSPILLFIVVLLKYALQLAAGAFRPLLSGGDSRCSWVSSCALGPMRGYNPSRCVDCNAGGGCPW